MVGHRIRHFCCLVGPAASFQVPIILPSLSFLIRNLGFAPNTEQILSTSRHGSELSDLLVKFYNLDSNLGYLRNLLTEMFILTSLSQAMIFSFIIPLIIHINSRGVKIIRFLKNFSHIFTPLSHCLLSLYFYLFFITINLLSKQMINLLLKYKHFFPFKI